MGIDNLVILLKNYDTAMAALLLRDQSG